MKSLTGDFMVCRIFQSAIVSMIYMILSYLLSSLKAIYICRSSCMALPRLSWLPLVKFHIAGLAG